MSQADIDVLRRGFEAFARDGIAGVLEFGTDDFELIAPGILAGERYVGREGMTTALDDQMDVFEEWAVEPREFIEIGRHILVVVRQRVRGRGSGVEFDTTAAWDFEMRDGKAMRLTIYGGVEEALAALGQSRRQ